MRDRFTVGIAQFVASEDRDANLERAATYVTEAVERGSDVIGLPEFFSIPFVPPEMGLDYFERAEPLDGPTVEAMRQLSFDHGIAIVCSFFERAEAEGVHHNAAVVLDHGEIVHHYRKSHIPLSSGFREKFYFRPGTRPPRVVTTRRGVRLGVIICYERHFPELSKTLSLDGAELILIPNATASAASRDGFHVEQQANAYGNQLFVGVANRIGTESSNAYFGESFVCGPDGKPLARADAGFEGVVIAECDRSFLRQVRVTTPLGRDRRPELYHRVIHPDVDPSA